MMTLLWVLCAVLGSTVPAMAETVLNWNANSESDLAGYKLYQGTVSGEYGPSVDLGNVTTYTLTLPALSVDQTYFWAITAYDTANNESRKSAEASKRIPATVQAPPTLPTVTEILLGDPATGPWAVEVTTTAVPPYEVEVWVNGVRERVEGMAPWCSWADNGAACFRVVKPAGTYVMEFRVIQSSKQVASTTLTVLIVDKQAPAPPSGLTVQ
jgi:hypothetical protein